ncbi:DUF5004 domain-containing protein [Flavobacterium pallidum]|uniref:DUF5004 domain-containing protein n=1 Tax=Flavobacterium pallidum TaxID=2172098 RepID=A0A2S1SI37_9FLAO|nr:DUF5004 domain-containing protein [Flavobacterium pallidum]AWI26007.1 DUF5004 domain-containing protein [Flavobacterium pallidum]
MRMKSIYGLLAIFLLCIGCTQDDDGSHVDPITLYEKVSGDWGLMSLKMVDEFAKANAIEPNEQNISTLFNYENFQLHLNVDDKMRPTTYEVAGDVPALFALSGYWNLSTDFQPTNSGSIMIYLYSDAAKTQLTDELKLTSVPGSNDEMEIQLIRKSGGTPFISYQFKLNAL